MQVDTKDITYISRMCVIIQQLKHLKEYDYIRCLSDFTLLLSIVMTVKEKNIKLIECVQTFD